VLIWFFRLNIVRRDERMEGPDRSAAMSGKWFLMAAQHREQAADLRKTSPNIRSGVITLPVAGLTSA
jgi:hypothetical protein